MPYYTDEEIPTSGGMEQFGLQYDPSMSVLFGESLMEGIRQLTPNLAKSYSELQYAGGTVYENEEQWQSSEFFREGLKFEERMTEGQARLLAERYDRSISYGQLAARADSLGDYGAIFGGMFIGSVPDPINFIPWLGFAKKGKQAKSLIDATTRGRAALRGSAEASLGAAAFHPLFALEKGAYQEEYDISMALVDVGLAAGIGAGLGSIFGRIHPDDPPPVAGMSDEAIRTQARQDLGDDLSIIRQEVRSQVWRGLDHIPPQTRVMAFSLAQSQEASGQTIDAARVVNQVEINSVNIPRGATNQQADELLDGQPSGLIRGTFQDSVLNNPDGTLQRWFHGSDEPSSSGLMPFSTEVEIVDRSPSFSFRENPEALAEIQKYKEMHQKFPEIFDPETGQVIDRQAFMDAHDEIKKFGVEALDELKNPDWPATFNEIINKVEDGFNKISDLANKAEIYPRFLNVKNPYPKAMDFKEAEKLGANWFKEQGYDAVYTTEEGGNKVILTVDPNQARDIADRQFVEFNEATSADPLPPVDETPVRNEFELEEENIDLEIAARESELTEQDAKDLAEMDEMVASVDRQAQAYRAAADCVMRT